MSADATDGVVRDRRFGDTLDLLAGAALLLLVSKVLVDPLLVNHDCGVLLFSGEWLLQGKLPFRDYYSLNPPLIDYLQVFPRCSRASLACRCRSRSTSSCSRRSASRGP